MKPAYRATIISTALALALGASGALLAREAPTMTVAVIDFTNQASSAGWWNSDVGNQLADVLGNELSATGDFKVIERQKIDAVLAEQDLAASYQCARAAARTPATSPAPSIWSPAASVRIARTPPTPAAASISPAFGSAAASRRPT